MRSRPLETFENSRVAGCLILGLLTLLFFFDLLFGSGEKIVSHLGTDIWRQFAGWRYFGFEEMRRGNFPLWTPYVYGGMPYFSGFQSALLYPPNWIYLILPLERAINWGVALHVWWIGAGMFLWMRAAGLRQVSALFCGVLLMFCAPHFLHIYAGHLTNLCVMSWAPWLFMAIWRWRQEQRVLWVALGAVAAAMQILAGHPQYVYYSGLMAVLFAATLLPGEGKLRFLLGFGIIYLAACLLTAVQLLPGIEASSESIRSGGVGKQFAGSYSFPPENLFTMAVPGLWGGAVKAPYWGRWFYWEMAAFFGVIACWCAAIGALPGKNGTLSKQALIVFGTGALLALGSYTPLFHILYAVVPGYDLFRGNSKFIFFAILFAVVLTGIGLDRLSDGERLRGEKILAIAGACLALACFGCALAISPAGDWWGGIREAIWNSGQVTQLSQEQFFSEELQSAAAGAAARALWIAGGILLLAVGAGFGRRAVPALPYALVVIGVVEMVVFSARFRHSFDSGLMWPKYQMAVREQLESDVRFVDVSKTNAGMLSGLQDLWGDDPGVLGRYAEFIAATQGVHPDQATQHLKIQRVHSLWAMLRVAGIISPSQEGVVKKDIPIEPLARFELVPRFEIVQGRDAVLTKLFNEGFDLKKTVLLEEEPGVPISDPGDVAIAGGWKIESEDTDEVVVEVSVDRACILLMTDPYSVSWKAENVQRDAPQDSYRVLPANYVLRGIPLAAGNHHLRLYFEPATFKPAATLSAASWLVLLGVLGWIRRKEKALEPDAKDAEAESKSGPRRRKIKSRRK